METRREEGTVVALDGGTARVRLARRDACVGCRVCATLGLGEMALEARNLSGARVGDGVVVEVTGPSPLRAALLVYGAPLTAFIAACVTGAILTESDGAGLAIGAAAFLCACAVLNRYDRRVRRSGNYSATVTGRTGNGGRDGTK